MFQIAMSRPGRVVGAEMGERTNGPSVQSIVQFIERRCFGRVHRLEIEQHDGRVVLYGRTSTYHAKQLVQHAAQEAITGVEVENRIEVEGRS